MKRWLLTLAMVLLAGLVGVAADRVAMFTEVSGSVQAGGLKARTLMPLGTGVEVSVPQGARATLTFFRDGHREHLQGPCRVRVSASGTTLLAGQAAARVRTAAAPSTMLAPSGQNLRRMGGGLQALAVPGSAEHDQVLALATFSFVHGIEEVAPPAVGGGRPYLLKRFPGEDGDRPPGGATPPLLAPAPSEPPAMVPAPAPPQAPEVGPAPGIVVAPVPEPSPEVVGEPEPEYAPAPEPPRLSQQQVYALDPWLSWAGTEQVLVTLERRGHPVWSQACRGAALAVPESVRPGDYLWRVRDLETSLEVSAQVTVLPKRESKRVRSAFEEARRVADASAWVLLMTSLADQGLYSEALQANQEALRLQPEDSTLHLAAARLLWLLAREAEARDQAIRGLELEAASGEE